MKDLNQVFDLPLSFLTHHDLYTYNLKNGVLIKNYFREISIVQYKKLSTVDGHAIIKNKIR